MRADVITAPVAGAWRYVVADTVTMVKRNVIRLSREPDVLLFSVVSPIMFVVLFAYVFGGVIEVSEAAGGYREYLVAGVFAQTAVSATPYTGAALVEDMRRGIIDRFRTLPMAPGAVLIGRTTSDVVINVVGLAVMSLAGLVVGWRVRGSWLDAMAAFALLVVFAYAVSWVMALIGLLVRTAEAFHGASLLLVFPLTFVANTYIPVRELPTILRVVAEWNPVSALTQAIRVLFGNIDPATASQAWPMQHPVAATLLWAALLLAISVPAAVRLYARSLSR
ncbi:ABC transporter permease [Nocardia rhizosphaerihabitans]|uniref:Transport permease protein n=1 Tax=Nocardia rhizosphaerihabitans TaxID=1691570 RepID=A0ABQ2KRA5_9NOCA|nr:ABC transporter permease [Nocardia rhizosphaerihabitans]GGN88991.1 transport permease protein [Nocardia rhizosphaerihabitans]